MADPAGQGEPAGPGGAVFPGNARSCLGTARAWPSSSASPCCCGTSGRCRAPGISIALVIVAVAAIMWAVGIFVLTTASASLDEEALVGEKVFRLITIGTLLLALVGLVLAFFGPT